LKSNVLVQIKKKKKIKIPAFSQQKCCISFPLPQYKSGTDPKFWRDW